MIADPTQAIHGTFQPGTNTAAVRIRHYSKIVHDAQENSCTFVAFAGKACGVTIVLCRICTISGSL
jgi:hypothetical protein